MTIDDGVFNNAGNIYVSATNAITNEDGSNTTNILTNTGSITVGSDDLGAATAGELDLTSDTVENFDGTNYGTLTVTSLGKLDLLGGVTIDDGVFNNAGNIYVSATNAITNEDGSNTTNILTNTGSITVGSDDLGAATAGELDLTSDTVENFDGTNYGTLTVTSLGKLDLLGGVTIDDGVFNNAGNIYVSATNAITNEDGSNTTNILTNTGSITVGSDDLGAATAGELDLTSDTVENFDGTNYGTLTVTSLGKLDLLGGVTIDDGVFNNAGNIYVSATNAITNEDGSNTTNILTNTGSITVGSDDLGAATAGELDLTSDTVENFDGTNYGTLTVTSLGKLDLLGGVTIDDGVFNNAGNIYVSATNAITNEDGSNTTNILTNTGSITVGSDDLGAATAGELDLTSDTVENFDGTNYGTLTVTSLGKLDLLGGVTIDDGVFNNAGNIYVSVGTNAITNAILITNNPGATIEATGAGVELEIKSATTFNNDGTLLATLGGTLDLDSLTVTNSATGLVQVDTLSFLDLEGATITGGTLLVTTGGTVDVNTGTSTIANLALGNFTNNGRVQVDAGASLVLLNDTMGGNGDLRVNGTGTLQISGDVVLGDGITTSTTGVGAVALTGTSGDDTISLTRPATQHLHHD